MSDLPLPPPTDPGSADPAVAGAIARVGLDEGQRYRCSGCGNVTRFDVDVSERARRFWHADLAGGGRIESEERETTVHEVRCRWCGSTDVTIEATPAAVGSRPPGTSDDAEPA